MIPVEALARPIIDLVETLGSGVSDTTGPDVGIRIATDVLEIAYQLGTAALGELAGGGTSTAGMNTATAITEQTQTLTRALGDRGTDITAVVDEATLTVQSGLRELNDILASFISVATSAGPTLMTPPGQMMLIGSAFEHLGRALSVIERIRGDLAGSTDKMSALIPSISLPIPSSSIPNSSIPNSSPAGASSAELQIDLPDGSVAAAPNAEAAAAVRNALTQQGVPYSWGGTSPGVGLDCSGLTQWAYGQAGIDIPRLAQEQGIGSPVDQGNLMPGDLAVWDGHVAMVIGNNQMIEAGDPVSVSPVRTSNIGMGFHGFYRPTA